MQITLTIDDDVTARIQERRQRGGQSPNQVSSTSCGAKDCACAPVSTLPDSTGWSMISKRTPTGSGKTTGVHDETGRRRRLLRPYQGARC